MIPKVSSCQEYFDTLDTRFIADAAAGVQATIVYDIAGDGGGQWTVTVEDGALAVEPGAVDGPTVTIKMKADHYVDMVNGDLDGTRAFMTRKLKVAGSIPMAQKMKKFLPPAEK